MVDRGKKGVVGAYPPRKQHRRGRRLRRASLLIQALSSIIPLHRTIIDLGAGKGACVKGLREFGYSIVGVDGTYNIIRVSEGLVAWADLTSNCSHLYGIADWGLLLEVGEHVPKEFEGDLIREVSHIPRKGLIVTWGDADDGYESHVNCQPPAYVADRFREYGWKVDKKRTKVFAGFLREQTSRRCLVMRKV